MDKTKMDETKMDETKKINKLLNEFYSITIPNNLLEIHPNEEPGINVVRNKIITFSKITYNTNFIEK